MAKVETTAIDRNNPLPYYVQVKDALVHHIESGEWPIRHQLPGEPELCQMFDVSRTVIRQALNDMEHEGLILRKKGKGTFVAEPKIGESLIQKLTGFYQDMIELGHNPVTHVLKQQVIPAPAKVVARLGLKAGARVIEIERLRFVQDEPINLVTTYLPYTLCPKAAEADFSARSLYEFLESECGLELARGHRTLEAVAANDYEARWLRVEKGAPLVLLDSVSYLEDGTPVEYYHALHRGDRSRFHVELIRIKERGNTRTIVGGEPADLPLKNMSLTRPR